MANGKSGKSKSSFILSIVSIVLAVLSFVSLAFNFLGATMSYGGNSSTDAASFGDWTDMLANAGEMDNIGWWQAARVFLIIALVIVGILAVIAIIRFFIDNKIFSMIMKFAGIAGIVAGIVFLVTFVVGCFLLSEEAFGMSMTYWPHVGAILLGVCTIASSVCASKSAKK